MKRRSKWDQLETDLQFSVKDSTEGPPRGMFPVGDNFGFNNVAPTQLGSNAAAATAARLNAMLAAQGKLMKAPAPPLIGNLSPQPVPPQLYTLEVTINDIPSRVMLTRSATHQEILRQTGAAVSVKGRFMTAEERSMGTMDRPLYLYICADTQAKVNAAGEKIKKIVLQSELSFPIDQRPFTNSPQLFNTIGFGSAQLQQRTEDGSPMAPGLRYVQDKVFVGTDSIPGFNVIENIAGPQGSYLRHVAAETGAKVFLRGRGSGYIEPTSGKESFEPLHLYISHPRSEGLHAAKRLCENLIQKVQRDYDVFIHSQHQPQMLLDGLSGGNWESHYKPGPPSLMSLQLPDPQMHHFPPARHPLPAGPMDFHPPHPPRQPLLMEPPFGYEAEPHPPFDPGAGPPLYGPPPHDPYMQQFGPPPCPPATSFDYCPPQPDYQGYNTQPSPQLASLPIPQPTQPTQPTQSPPLGFSVSWNPAAGTDEPPKEKEELPVLPPAKRRFTEVVTDASQSNSVKTPSQSSDSSIGNNSFKVPDIVPQYGSPRRSQPSQNVSTGSSMPPPPTRGSATFSKPPPPVWQDKPKEQTGDKLQGKSKGVSGLASLMAYEGDSDDSEST